VNETTTRELEVAVWRGDGGGEFVTYRVPARADQTVLDVVTFIQRGIDPTLAYRFSCRVGMCGSCAMTVNGRPCWTCRTLVATVAKGGGLSLSPLANMPVIRDLVADMTGFFDKWRRAKGRFIAAKEPPKDFARVPPASPERRAADAAIECINCGVCYAGCDVVGWKPDYVGPAALGRAWTLHNDVRDADRAGHLSAVAGDAGCHACHSHQNCMEFCPKGLNPTASIAGLKRAVAGAYLKGQL
jgi:fumarate reductase iron-sulfur subunit